MGDFAFGGAKVAATGRRCCGKPVGCTISDPECLYLQHPWKRGMVFDDRTVRCPATSVVDGEQRQCEFMNGHAGVCRSAALEAGDG